MDENGQEGSPRSDGGYEMVVGVPASSGQPGRLGSLGVIAETEYRLAVRNRWAVALTVAFLGFALGLITFSGASVGPTGYARIIASLAILAVYLVPLAALVFGYDAIVGAEETGWLQTLFALPIARWRLAVGSFLGRAVIMSGAIVIGFGIAGAILIRDVGLVGLEAYASFLVATIALGLAFLAIAVCLSAWAPEKTQALGAGLFVWAWFVLVHDLLALGVIAAFRLPEAALTAMVLTNPAGVYRVLVLDTLGAGGDAGFAAVLTAAGLSPLLLVIALFAWIAGPLTVGAIVIERRRV